MARRVRTIEYPGSDGHPMTEHDINRLLMEYTEHAIRTKFCDHATGYVSANLFIYYVEGDARKRVAPDTFFVKGATKELREVYKLWDEGLVPDVAFEYVARASYRLDPEKKRDIYERLGIPEYYVFDPKGRWLKPPLRAYLLREDGRYEEIRVDGGEIASPRLGLTMRVEGQWLRFYDTATGQPMPTPEEAQEAAVRALERAERAEERVRQMERELAEIRASLPPPEPTSR